MDGVIGRPVQTEPIDKWNSSNCIRGRALPWSLLHLFDTGVHACRQIRFVHSRDAMRYIFAIWLIPSVPNSNSTEPEPSSQEQRALRVTIAKTL